MRFSIRPRNKLSAIHLNIKTDSKLIVGALGSVGVKVLGTLLNLTISLTLARMLNPEGYGIYVFAISAMALLAIPVQFGIPTLLVREVARFQYGENWPLLRGLLVRANQSVILLSITMALTFGVYLLINSERFGAREINVFYWALLLLPLSALARLREATLQGLRRTVIGQLPEQIITPITFLSLCGLTILLSQQLTPASTMALFCISTGSSFVIGAYLLFKALPVEVRKAEGEYKTKEWAAAVIPLSLLAGLHTANNQADILMLGLLGTKDDVGLYRVALSGAALVIFLQTAINLVFAPYIARLFAANERVELQRMTQIVVRSTFLFSLPVTGILVVFGEPILEYVFGSSFTAAHQALAVLCLAQLINVATGPASVVLNMTRNENITLRAVFVGLVVNIIANLILVPRYGNVGAAASGALSISIVNIFLCYFAYTKIGIRTFLFWSRSSRF